MIILMHGGESIHRIARVEIALRASCCQQDVLFNLQFTESIKVSSIPCEMGMRIAKARHKCSPFAVEDTDFWIFLQRILVRNLTHGNYFLT
jgi:hypothetical protein